MVGINVIPVYHGTSERLDVELHLEGTVHTQYELSKLLEHLETIGKLLPTTTNPDE